MNERMRLYFGFDGLRLDGVSTSCSELAKSVAPVIGMDPKVVDGAADQSERFAVEEETGGCGDKASFYSPSSVVLI